MNIRGDYNNYRNLYVNKAKPAYSTAASQEPAMGSKAANVELSETAKKLGQQETKQSGTFDQAKVDRLKAAIADGSYELSAEKIADSMLQAMKGK